MKAVKIDKKKTEEDAQKDTLVLKAKSSEKDTQKPIKSKKVEAPKKKTKKGEAFYIEWWNQSRQYLREVVSELRKVAWPSRKETIASTSVVLVVVLIIGMFLGFADLILSRFMRFIIG